MVIRIMSKRPQALQSSHIALELLFGDAQQEGRSFSCSGISAKMSRMLSSLKTDLITLVSLVGAGQRPSWCKVSAQFLSCQANASVSPRHGGPGVGWVGGECACPSPRSLLQGRSPEEMQAVATVQRSASPPLPGPWQRPSPGAAGLLRDPPVGRRPL